METSNTGEAARSQTWLSLPNTPMQRVFVLEASLLLLTGLAQARDKEQDSRQEVGHTFDRCLPKKFEDMDGTEKVLEQEYQRIIVDFRNEDIIAGVYMKEKNVSRFDQYHVEAFGSAKGPLTPEHPKEHWFSFWRGVLKDNPRFLMFARGEFFTGGWFHYREWFTEGGRGGSKLVRSCWHYNFENEADK